ncbi:Ubiquinone/menaquinone biosynthesis C-methylase UbiE [Paenibacillus uliginis N3/975]|uniref:Ubiquinone/menaquinone biosynthesis C-methylase UbiE n=1 Tax=Paenibacillus uliginis N3/975 TaxID=1313296 RepID=A0A1X7G7F2_9BACL|nr:hypothetical protein [Paenibacillus uliginis]SMF65389.1 Ubiquinone/menaquinone biosynthesis C-methylase UbiE [Paenibacillus uliginis N3/975]
MRIDLGCGSDKHANCTGIDIQPGKNVDIVHDFEQSIPLLDDAVSFVMASRSLEYSRDLLTVMREIYRVCEHKALVCILAPYSRSALHIANPAIQTYFNEYTPFYLTSKGYHRDLEMTFGFTPNYIPEEAPGLGFRLLRMEMFYFPDVRATYKIPDREEIRQSLIDVADEVMYHFMVVKKPVTNLECCVLAASKLEEPNRIAEWRRRELSTSATSQIPRETFDNPLYIELAEPEDTGSTIKPAGKPPSSAAKRKGALKMKKGKKRSRLIRVKSVAREGGDPSLQRNTSASHVLFDIRDLYIGAAWRAIRQSGESDGSIG